MNVWTLGMTIFAGILIVFGIWGRLEERRWRRDHTPCGCFDCRVRFYQDNYRLGRNPNWPDESDGVDLTDRDWDLAAKLELYEKDQDA